MQISNNPNSQAFTGIQVQTSKMNKVQKALSDRISDIISYSDEYVKASEAGVDVYFIPGRVEDRVKVLFMDTDSDMFYRKDNEKRVFTILNADKENFKQADNVLEKLKQIVAGVFKEPEYDAEKILKGETDLFELRPELYEDLITEIDELAPGIGRSSAEDLVLHDRYHIEQIVKKDQNF